MRDIEAVGLAASELVESSIMTVIVNTTINCVDRHRGEIDEGQVGALGVI
jgi:hypothetical protein